MTVLPGETIQLLTAAVTSDPYSGGTFLDWSKTPSSVDITDVLCEPRPVGEPVLEARNQVTSGWTLYCQGYSGALPTPDQRVKVRGIVYEIDGVPAEWVLGGWVPGIVIQAKIVEG